MQTTDEIMTEHLRELIADDAWSADPWLVHVSLCPVGDHLRAARRWRATCAGCGQLIPTGNVGPFTWDSSQGPGNPVFCEHGFYDFQHGCGTWNPPTEVTIDPTDYVDARAALAAVLDMLRAKVGEEVAVERVNVEARLRRELADKLAEVRGDSREAVELRAADAARAAIKSDAGPDERVYDADDRVYDAEYALRTGDETTPGVWRNDGKWEAWDVEPSSEEPLVVTEDEL